MRLFQRRFFLVLAFSCLVAFSSTVSTSAQKTESECDPSIDFDAYLSQANEAYEAGDLETTLTETTCALAANPDSPDAYNLRGIVYFNREDYETADSDFTQAINLDETDPDYVRNRAATRFRLERYEDAYEDFATANRLAPDWEVPIFGMADALFSSGRYDESIAAYRDGIARFGSSDSRNARLRRIAAIRSGALIDSRSPAASGAITADSVSALIPLDQLEGETIGSIVGVAISPSGTLLASGDSTGMVSFWDNSGEPLLQLDLQGEISTLVASSDGAYLAAVVDNDHIALIANGSQSVVAELDSDDDGSAALKGVTFTPDGAVLAAVWEDGTIRLYDTFLHALIGIITQDNVSAEAAITFSPNGRYISIAVDETSIQLWDILDLTLVTTWSGAEEAIHTLTFNAVGNRLYGGSDEALYYWNSDGGDPTATRIEMDAPVTDIRFSPDDLLVAVAAGAITLFDADSMEQISQIDSEDGAWSAIAFSPDGNQLIAGQVTDDTQNVLSVFEPFTTTIALELTDYQAITPDNADTLEVVTEVPVNAPRGTIWSADGDTLFLGSDAGIFSFPLDGDDAHFIPQPSGSFAIYEEMPIFQTVETDADGEQMLIVYDVEDFENPLASYDAGETVYQLYYVYRDDYLVAIAPRPENGIRIMDIMQLPLDGGDPQRIAIGGTEALNGIAIRPDSIIAIAQRAPSAEMVTTSAINLIDADGATSASINAPIPYISLAGQVQLGFIQTLSFSPDGTLLVAGASPNMIRVWQEVEPGVWEAIANFDPPTGSMSSQFSPSGQWMFSRGNDEIVIWHIDQGEDHAQLTEAVRIPVKASAVRGSISFNANETLIAIVTTDNTLQIWGVEG